MGKVTSPTEVGQAFSDQWWADEEVHPDVYDDLIGKMKDRNYSVKCKPATLINRAFLACDYVIKNVPKGSRVLVMACGIGFNACCLATYGYVVEGFDVSEKAIERARLLAQRLGQGPEMFYVADVGCIREMADESFDAVLAIGLFRYLERETQDMCHKNIHRILKPKGKFLVVHQNLLFETFALNEGTLRFWADVIEDYSGAQCLLGDKNVIEALSKFVQVPKRKYKPHSISKNMKVQAENPITYHEVAGGYGFRLEKILYPCSHLLPPFLEEQVDQDKLEDLKRRVWLDRIDDWRAMFVEFEFLAFLEKK